MYSAESGSSNAGGSGSSCEEIPPGFVEEPIAGGSSGVVGDGRCRSEDCQGVGERCELEVIERSIKRFSLKRMLVRSIIASDDEKGCYAVSYYLGDVSSRQWHVGGPSFVAFCAHATGGPRPHTHVWHDCKLLQGNCRCAFLAPFKNGRRDFGGTLITSKTAGHRRHFRAVPTQELQAETSRGFHNILRWVQ